MHGDRVAGDGLSSLNGSERAAGWQTHRLPGLHVGSEPHEPDQRRDKHAVYAPGSWVTDTPAAAVDGDQLGLHRVTLALNLTIVRLQLPLLRLEHGVLRLELLMLLLHRPDVLLTASARAA